MRGHVTVGDVLRLAGELMQPLGDVPPELEIVGQPEPAGHVGVEVRVLREFRTAHGTAPSCGEFCDALMRSLSPRSAPVAPWGVRGMVPWLCPGRGPGWDHRPAFRRRWCVPDHAAWWPRCRPRLPG